MSAINQYSLATTQGSYVPPKVSQSTTTKLHSPHEQKSYGSADYGTDVDGEMSTTSSVSGISDSAQRLVS